MKKNHLWKVLKIALFGVVAVAAVTFVVMSLWNVLMPGIFEVKTIGFWQALGLIVLCKILFGSFRGAGRGPRWKRRLRDRWENMTPEEREKFKQGMSRGCGRRGNVQAEARA